MGNHKYPELEKEFKRLKNLGLNYGRFKNSWEDYLEELIYLENKFIFDNISESEYKRILDQGINIGKFHNHEGGEENLGELSWIIIQDNPEFIENLNQFLNDPKNLDEYRFNLESIEEENFHLIEKFYYDHHKEFESFIIHQDFYYDDDELKKYIYLDFKSSYSLRNEFYQYIYDNIFYYLRD